MHAKLPSGVQEAGQKAILMPGDVQKANFCQKLVEAATNKLGRVDIIVNNAAFQHNYEKPSDIPEEEFDRTFRTNVYGTFFLSQAAIEKLEEGGTIINTCSIQAYDPSPGLLAYAATKAALVNFTKGLAKGCSEAEYSCEWRCAGTGLDATHSSDPAQGEGG